MALASSMVDVALILEISEHILRRSESITRVKTVECLWQHFKHFKKVVAIYSDDELLQITGTTQIFAAYARWIQLYFFCGMRQSHWYSDHHDHRGELEASSYTVCGDVRDLYARLLSVQPSSLASLPEGSSLGYSVAFNSDVATSGS